MLTENYYDDLNNNEKAIVDTFREKVENPETIFSNDIFKEAIKDKNSKINLARIQVLQDTFSPLKWEFIKSSASNGLYNAIEKSKSRCLKYDDGKTFIGTFTSAARTMITVSTSDDNKKDDYAQISFICAEDDPVSTLGVQSYDGKLKDIKSLIDTASETFETNNVKKIMKEDTLSFAGVTVGSKPK